MNDADSIAVAREAVVDAFMELDLPLDTAEKFAQLTMTLASGIACIERAQFIGAFRGTMFGTALERAYVGDTRESQAEAARRLRVSRKALAKTEIKVRELLKAWKAGEGGRTPLLLSKSKTDESDQINSRPSGDNADA